MLRWKRSFWSWKGCRMDTETRRLFRALFRKQLREQGAFLVRSASTGRHRTRAGRLAFGVLYGGIVLLVMFVVYMVLTVRQSFRDTVQAGGADEAIDGTPSMGKDILLLVIGAAFIAVGANLLVNNGTLIAQGLGVPESVIALTFVALGTSLPELVTAITSLVKGHSALSLGNIVGANLFNLVLVSGLSTTLSPFQVPQEKTIAGYNASLVVDIPLMMLVMLLLTVPALLKGKLSRPQGIALLCIYAAFCVVQFTI